MTGNMEVFIVLLRAVNVGGTGKLPMSALKQMCIDAGYSQVQTYIASGNVIFETEDSAEKIKCALEKRLELYAGKPVGVLVRSAKEMAEVLASNPFPNAAPNQTVAIFLDKPPAKDALSNLKGQKDEEVKLGAREIFVHYADGIGKSKLVIPAAQNGTARNMNTIAKLVQLASSS